MDRREFLAGSLVSAGVAAAQPAWPAGALDMFETSEVPRLDLTRHRFGVNYTPSHNWWYCWNDWDADPIKRDLDAIATLGADHLRIFPIWPFFQPNPKQVSPPHLERFDQLLTLMGERKLDALVTVFTGGLSAFAFMPPFPPPPQAGGTISAACFLTSSRMWGASHVPSRSFSESQCGEPTCQRHRKNGLQGMGFSSDLATE